MIIILGLIVFVHELGHFIAAKKSGVHVYEFAIGMGPKIFSFKRKNDPTIYSLRLLPLGGFNAIASTMETCEGVKESEVLENKSGFKRFAVLVMGIVFNFILSIILLLINGLIYGSPVTSPYLGNVLEGSAAEKAAAKQKADAQNRYLGLEQQFGTKINDDFLTSKGLVAFRNKDNVTNLFNDSDLSQYAGDNYIEKNRLIILMKRR